MKDNNQSLVSVVIPCYNHEKFVQDCIKSVIDQTYQNIELIIIDDGSKDQSVEKIKEMAENYGRKEEEVKDNPELVKYVGDSLKTEKTIDFLVENAKIK